MKSLLVDSLESKEEHATVRVKKNKYAFEDIIQLGLILLRMYFLRAKNIVSTPHHIEK